MLNDYYLLLFMRGHWTNTAQQNNLFLINKFQFQLKFFL